jgi:hypothetical protein
VIGLYEADAGIGLAYIASHKISPLPSNELPSPNRLLITLAERKTLMTSLLGIISNMSHNNQSESAKRGMATVTGDTEKDRNLHTVACVGIATQNSKMPDGEEKDKHTVDCVGVVTVNCKMPEGPEKINHVTAGEDGGASKQGKMTESYKRDEHVTAIHNSKEATRMRMLQYLNQNWRGEWYLASATKSRRKGAKTGEMIRDVGAKTGEPCLPTYAWCFAKLGINTTLTSRSK